MDDFLNDPSQNDPNKQGADLEFTVMPRLQEREPEPPVAQQGNSNAEFDPNSDSNRRSFWKSKMFKFFAGGIVLLLILGTLVILLWPKPKPSNQTNTAPANIPQISVPPAPPTNLDSDNDGLTDAQEVALGTDPKNPDTDHDGIADGDEVNIYHTDPLLPDTNGNGYDDGTEIANGYDPNAKPSQKASPQLLQTWADRIKQYGLHEPTITTLKLKAAKSSGDAKPQTYVNKQLGFAIDIPATLKFRESPDGSEVGIFINGTTPTDSNLLSDPISVSVGVKTQGQSLADWIKSQYPDSSYQKQQPVTVKGGANGLQVLGIQNDVCPLDKTFLDKNASVIILTWTCNYMTPFEPLYKGIVDSFRFLP